MEKLFMLLMTLILTQSIQAQTADQYFKEAQDLNAAGKYNLAINVLDLAINLDSTNGEFWAVKGFSFVKMEKFQEAYDCFTEGIRVTQGFPELYFDRGTILLYSKRERLAIQDFNKGLSLNPGDTLKRDLLQNLAAAKINIRDFKGAYKDLRGLYLMDSNDLGTINNLAQVYSELGKQDSTFIFLKKALKIDSTMPALYSNLGFWYQNIGNYKESLSSFDKGLELALTQKLNDSVFYGFAYGNRGYSYFKLDNIKKALSDVNKSISYLPSNSYTYRTRALIYIAKNQKEKACEDLNKAIDLGFTDRYGEEVIQLKLEHCQ